ncbi:MAG: SDR family oxidoreductase [Micrococcales bacterium]|nr:SDR family oxidoreductase [Micrococcales bacterium]MCL2667148.1 SDR family oxidoreductase [Micrococcales bacterium]
MGTALVTGASAGIGLEFAWQLATARHDLVLVARDRERLEHLAGQLRAAAGVRTEVLVADLSDRGDVDRVAARLAAAERPVGLLINNAGYAPALPFVDDDLASQEQALDVMVRVVMVLSHAAATAMRARGRGAILNVGSVAGLMATSAYSAHKAWVQTFTEALAVELDGTGVTATCLRPGLTRTEFHDRAGVDVHAYPEIAWLDTESVVACALSDVRRGTVLSTPSLRYQTAATALKLLPRAAVRSLTHLRDAIVNPPDEHPDESPEDPADPV